MYRFALILALSICCLSQLIGQEVVNSPKIPEHAIPIDYRKHIYIKGSVKSMEGNFVFDTGASNFYFDSLFYLSNNFKYDSIALATLPGAGKKPQNVRLILNSVEFNFGDFKYQTNKVPIFNLKAILGDFADGIIGWEYFSKKAVEISYFDKYLKVHKAIDSLPLHQYTKIQCQNIKGKFLVPVTLKINDSISFTNNYTLDIGSGKGIILTNPTALKYNLKNNITNKMRFYSKYAGVGGESEGYSFLAKSIDIAGYKLENFAAEFSSDKSGALSSNKCAGLLGNVILERFDIIIDYPNSCLYLKPNATFNNPFIRKRLGFSFVNRSQSMGALVVTGFHENTSAEKSGLKIDDKILDINGVSVKDMDYYQLEDYLNKTNKLVLKVKRASEILIFEITT